MKKLFGTDGIRGKFKQWPLTVEIIYAVSLATGQWLKKKYSKKKTLRVIIGQDTRYSCDEIEQYLAWGFNKNNIEVYTAGIVPTPGLAFLANTMDVELGIMISASHNPAEDNGIKFFKHNGFKLTAAEEKQIEKIAYDILNKKSKFSARSSRIDLEMVSIEPYLEHLKKSVRELDLIGKKVVVDCANGAVSAYAKWLFEDLGAKVKAIGYKPDGYNINRNCGSLYPEKVAEHVKKNKADIGFAFDGDGDRVIFCDHRGTIYDGDHIMVMGARYFKQKKLLANNTVVATSMSNFGLEKSLKEMKVNLVRADVGDKYVLKELLKHKAVFGGEQSGHMLFLEHATTGDGMLTALQILKILNDTGKKVNALISGFKKYPQVLINVRVKEKKEFSKLPGFKEKVKYVNKQLEGEGRLVLRYSGTEPLARVMIEGSSKPKINKLADILINAIKDEIGE